MPPQVMFLGAESQMMSLEKKGRGRARHLGRLRGRLGARPDQNGL